MTGKDIEAVEGELLPMDPTQLRTYAEEARDKATGRFKPGYSGNMVGRTKGIRNKITLDRLMVEDSLRVAIAKKSPELIVKALDMALAGNEKVMRVLLDKLLSTPKHDDPADAKDNSVKVVIQNLTDGGRIANGQTPTVRITSDNHKEVLEHEDEPTVPGDGSGTDPDQQV